MARRRKHCALTTLATITSTGSVASGVSTAGVSSIQAHVSSTAAGSAALEHAASDAGSSVGSSSLGAEGDSMRPLAPPARKRRRTIIDAFSSINLNHRNNNNNNFGGHNSGEETEGDGGGDDADSSQAVAEHEGDDITTSSIEDDCTDGQAYEDHDRFLLLSDKEEAERKVMFELVFGPLAGRPLEEPVLKNPVDVQLDKMLARDARRMQQQQQKDLKNQMVPVAVQDDTKIHPPYARPFSMMTTVEKTESTRIAPSTLDFTPFTRSNSLPDLWFPQEHSDHGNAAMNEAEMKGNDTSATKDKYMME